MRLTCVGCGEPLRCVRCAGDKLDAGAPVPVSEADLRTAQELHVSGVPRRHQRIAQALATARAEGKAEGIRAAAEVAWRMGEKADPPSSAVGEYIMRLLADAPEK